MEHRDLFAGFNCTDLEAQMIPHTLTASVCQPSVSDHVSLTHTSLSSPEPAHLHNISLICSALHNAQSYVQWTSFYVFADVEKTSTEEPE